MSTVDIYTDASFDKNKYLAGVGMVCAHSFTREEFKIHHPTTFLYASDINLAELFAIDFALKRNPRPMATIALHTDSLNALEAIAQSLENPQSIDEGYEGRILHSICQTLINNTRLKVELHHIKAHQKTPMADSHAYFNGKADGLADLGRYVGKISRMQGNMFSDEEKYMYQQMSKSDYAFIKDKDGEWKGRILLMYKDNQDLQYPVQISEHKKEKCFRRQRNCCYIR